MVAYMNPIAEEKYERTCKKIICPQQIRYEWKKSKTKQNKQKKKNTQPESPQLQEACKPAHMLQNTLHQKSCWKIDMEGQLV